MLFSELTIKPEVMKGIQEAGYTELTPVQELVRPYIRKGADVIGKAQTGSGKTAAFAVPLLESCTNEKKPQVLVLNPTRELAIQSANEFSKLGKFTAVTAVPVYGGQSYELQIRAIRAGAQIIVGTPGRVMDLYERGALDLSRVTKVVLDEADEMLNMGFHEDIDKILGCLPSRQQTLLFSATMPKQISDLAEQYLNDAISLSVADSDETLPDIDQSYIVVTPEIKPAVSALLIQKLAPRLTLVFCNTRHKVDEVTNELLKAGVKASSLHGEMRQTERDIVMERYRSGLLPVLVATDVAARGLDIRDVDLIINYDMPKQLDLYIHRIGRTGRAGQSGQAVSLVGQRDSLYLKRLQEYTGRTLVRQQLPRPSEIADRQISELIHEGTEAAATGISKHCLAAANGLIEKIGDPEKAVAALLKLIMLQRKNRFVPDNYPDGELPFGREARRKPSRKHESDPRPDFGSRKKHESRPDASTGKRKERRREEKEEHPVHKASAQRHSSHEEEASYYGAAARRKAKEAKTKNSKHNVVK